MKEHWNHKRREILRMLISDSVSHANESIHNRMLDRFDEPQANKTVRRLKLNLSPYLDGLRSDNPIQEYKYILPFWVRWEMAYAGLSEDDCTKVSYVKFGDRHDAERWGKKRYRTSLSKLLRRWFSPNKKEGDYISLVCESFVSRARHMFSDVRTYVYETYEDIVDAYKQCDNHGVLYSCMRDNPADCLRMYADNSESVKLLVRFKDDELITKAWLWKTDDGWYLDRVYNNSKYYFDYEADVVTTSDGRVFPLTRERYNGGKQIDMVKILWREENIPYLDTFRYVVRHDGFLYLCRDWAVLENHFGREHIYAEARSQNGYPEWIDKSGKVVWDDIDERLISREDAVFVRSIDGYTHINNAYCCERCGEGCLEHEIYFSDYHEEHYCEDCISEMVYVEDVVSSGTTYGASHFTNASVVCVDGRMYCSGDDRIARCEMCGEYVLAPLVRVGDDYICEACADKETAPCERCGEVIYTEDAVCVNNDYLCEACAESEVSVVL